MGCCQSGGELVVQVRCQASPYKRLAEQGAMQDDQEPKEYVFPATQRHPRRSNLLASPGLVPAEQPAPQLDWATNSFSVLAVIPRVEPTDRVITARCSTVLAAQCKEPNETKGFKRKTSSRASFSSSMHPAKQVGD